MPYYQARLRKTNKAKEILNVSAVLEFKEQAQREGRVMVDSYEKIYGSNSKIYYDILEVPAPEVDDEEEVFVKPTMAELQDNELRDFIGTRKRPMRKVTPIGRD